MTIRFTAYDTLVGEGQQIGKIQHAIAGAFSLGNGMDSINENTVRLIGGTVQTQMIPAFNHPMLCANPHTHDNKKIIVDMRSYGQFDPLQQEFRVRVRTGYDFDYLRAQLNAIWVNESPFTLERLSTLPLKLFAGWIAENLGRLFALNQREQDSVRVWAGAFYLSNFMPQDDFEQGAKTQFVMALQRGLGMNPSYILPITDKLERPISGLLEFCEQMQNVTESVRFKGYNAGILLAQLRGTWFSSNNPEIVPVALEHPPTWLAMLCAAATDRSFKNTDIHRRLEHVDRQDRGQLLVRSIQALVQSNH